MAQTNKTLIVAHRGKVSEHQENSLAAIEAALADPQCDGVEFDVFLMQDGQVVVFHDEDMERLTGVKQSIYSMNAEKIKQFALQKVINVDGGQRAYPKEESIPLLKDVLRAIKNRRSSSGKAFFVDIELKAYSINPFNYAVGPAAAAIVKELGMLDQCILSSFNYFMIAAAKKAVPDIKTIIAYDDNMPLSVEHLNQILESNFLGDFLQTSGVIAEHTLLDNDSVKKLNAKQLVSGSFTFYPLNCDAAQKQMYNTALARLSLQGLTWVETDNIEYCYELLNSEN